MKTFYFSLTLGDPVEHVMMEEMADRLFEAGCDDSMSSASGGVAEISFSRTSENLRHAITTAIQQVESCGLHVLSVELNDELSNYDEDERRLAFLVQLSLASRKYIHSSRQLLQWADLWLEVNPNLDRDVQPVEH